MIYQTVSKLLVLPSSVILLSCCYFRRLDSCAVQRAQTLQVVDYEGAVRRHVVHDRVPVHVQYQ